MHYKRWSKEDIEFLVRNYGRIKIPNIALKLGRSIRAIDKKIMKLNLGHSYETQGHLTATEIGNAIGRSKSTMYMWVNKYGLESTKRVTNKKQKYHMIKINDFWKFIKDNPGLMKWELYERGALIPEPKWIDEEIKNYYEIRIKNRDKKWSKTEECYLLSYYNQGKQVKEISKLMGRSKNAIWNRLKKLNAKKRIIKIKWKSEEDEILIEMRKQGMLFKDIAEELGRSTSSTQRRYERIRCNVC